MRQELRQLRLLDEHSAGPQYTSDLGERLTWASYVKEGPEVDDDVEGGIVEWHPAHVGADQLAVDAHADQTLASLLQQFRVYVQPYEARWLTQSGERRQGNPSTTTDLKHESAGWNSQGSHERRDLPPLLTEVTPRLVGKGLVVRRHLR